jgi:2-haloacid dehalogenase
MPASPLLIFDVNETLLDLDALAPHFERMFGDRRMLRDWFAQLILYSEAVTLAGEYADFGALGGAVLRMLGKIARREITEQDVAAIKEAVMSMPPQPEVESALKRLQAAGFRMFTLTNNPAQTADAQLRRGRLREYFERTFSIDEVVRQYKPARKIYRWVADEIGAAPSECCLIACHVWDTIGAGAAGMRTALILRPGNAALAVGPQPDIIGDDLAAVAGSLIELHAS